MCYYKHYMENSNVEKPIPEKSAETPLKKSKIREHVEKVWDLIKFAAIALAIVLPIRMYIAQPFIVSGESMFPTFKDGQYLVIDELSYHTGNPKRGDVVVFRFPNDTSRFFIKRVIGLPNEKISIRSGVITVRNKDYPEGFSLTEPYVNEDFNTTEDYATEDEEYFVMGDNRNRSSDSRDWGVVPRSDMIGRAYLRLLPVNDMDYMPGAYREEK
jgi:signal peptidase I